MHERAGIPSASAGLGTGKEQAMRDLNSLIFKYTVVSVLEEKFEEARRKYSHSESMLKYLKSLEKRKEKICRAFTQANFSFNHTTTQRGEGWNDKLKGHAALKAKLMQATLPELLDHIDAICADASNKALKLLEKVRKDDDRVSPSYKEEVRKSLELSTLTTSSCEKVDNLDAQYIVTQTNGEKFVVNLKSKIMHRGELFEIPTCSCGYYMSSFRQCRHIVKALVVSSDPSRSTTLADLIAPMNIHPFHLTQLHPLWSQAVSNVHRTDYNDLPQVNRLIASSNAVVQSSDSANDGNNGAACPDEFYVYRGKKKVPSEHKVRHSTLKETFSKTAQLAVNLGDAETFQLFHARMLQCQKEVRDIIGRKSNTTASLNTQVPLPLPPPMPASNKKESLKNASTNNSRLNTSSSSGEAKKSTNRRQPKKRPPPTLNCPQCELLSKLHNISVVYNDHSLESCTRKDIFEQYFSNTVKPTADGMHEAV